MARITYREAAGLDISNIFRLLHSEYAALELPYPVLNEHRTISYIANLVQHPNGKVWVADLSGRIVGALVCSIVRPLWSDTWMLNNDFFVVEPHFRKHGVAQNLMTAAKAFSEEKRLPIWFETTCGGRAELKDRWVAMQGLDYIGGRSLYWPKSFPVGGAKEG